MTTSLQFRYNCRFPLPKKALITPPPPPPTLRLYIRPHVLLCSSPFSSSPPLIFLFRFCPFPFLQMGFFEEDPTVIASQILYKIAVVIALLRWVLFCIIRFRNRNSSSSSSSSTSSQQRQQPPSPPSPQTIKERLVLASFGDVRARMPWVSDTCAVCLNHMEEGDLVRELRNCCHVFHKQCIDRWVDYDHHKTCPLCRAPLLTDLQSMCLNNWPKNDEPNWAVERILYIFGDDLIM